MMQSPIKFEEEIKGMLSEKVENIYPSENMFYEIKRRLDSERKSIMNINRVKKSRSALVACIILILTTVTCFAAVKIASYEGHSYRTFSEYPTAKEMQQEAGFVPKYIKVFANGYTFDSGSVGEMSGKDEDGNKVSTAKFVSLDYIKGHLSIHVSVDNTTGLDAEEETGEKIAITKELQGKYVEYMNKSVPGDYKMTEQDKKDEKEGKYVFSFGSNKIEISHVQSLSWEDGSMTYDLGCYDDGLNKAQMIEMAKEIINR